VEGLFRRYADATHGAQGSAKGATLGDGFSAELERQPAAFAVVGLGEIDELEVKTEGAAQLVGLVDRHGVCAENGELEQIFRLFY